MSITRVRRAATAALAGLAMLAAGAAGAAGAPAAAAPADELSIGLIVPLSGPYQVIGADMRAGFDLYLNQHGHKLGGHPVKVVVVDEGDGGAVARAGIDKLLKSDHVDAVVGTATAPAVLTVSGPATAAHVPFIGTGGRPSTLSDLSYTWHTSFLSTDFGTAAGPTVHQRVGAPVYAIGPDYQGGHDQIDGFTHAYTAASGGLANPGGKATFTPWPGTLNFTPWLAQIPDTGARAVYAFYAGAPAVAFVKQYAQLGLAGKTPLYGPGFLTEGTPALAAEGQAADRIFTVMPYAPGLDNPTNAMFAPAVRAAYHTQPTLYHVSSYDAAAVLDQAIADAGPNPTPQAINSAIGALGPLDSPRGQWRFGPDTHAPIQQWYLRQVTGTGEARTNTVIAQLGSIGH